MEIKTKEQALEVARELERLEATRKAMRNGLRVFVEKNGEIDTGETIWAITESVSWKHTAESLKKIAEGIFIEGVNPWEHLNITPAKLKSLGVTEEYMRECGSESRTTKRFSSRVSR